MTIEVIHNLKWALVLHYEIQIDIVTQNVAFQVSVLNSV